MKKKEKKLKSLRTQILTTTALCWALPVLIVTVAAAVLLSMSAVRTARNELAMNGESALQAVNLRMNSAIEASKAVSYDGVIKEAYRVYLAGGSNSELYSSSGAYLSQQFSRDENVKAVMIHFLTDDAVTNPYLLNRQDMNLRWLTNYRENVEPSIISFISEKDTGIYFFAEDGELYMVRKLFDSRFEPYAVLTIICDSANIFRSLTNLSYPDDALFSIDGQVFSLSDEGTIEKLSDEDLSDGSLSFSTDVDGHSIVYLSADEDLKLNLLRNYPELGIACVIVLLLAILVLPAVYAAYTKNITNPVNTLLKATGRVRNGDRGYLIEDAAQSEEFRQLFGHFNDMSSELKSQFERIYLEQQTLQQTRIKALQSQINPHFLNNTLEIINWEARIAGNDKISAMIEALSTMLDAALDRDERSMIPLREELTYVDAYLYIIRERLGEGFETSSSIDPGLESILIPRLILQPLVENAVEHDITPRRGGRLAVRAGRVPGGCVLEVENDGVLSEENRRIIKDIINNPDTQGASKLSGQVGLRNVCSRLALIYEGSASLSVEQISEDKIRAKIFLPASGQEENGKN